MKSPASRLLFRMLLIADERQRREEAARDNRRQIPLVLLVIATQIAGVFTYKIYEDINLAFAAVNFAVAIHSWFAQRWKLCHLALFVAFMFLFVSFHAARTWPLHLLLPISAYLLVVLAEKNLRLSIGWRQKGELNKPIVQGIVGIVAVSAAGLLLWFFLFDPQVGDLKRMIPAWSPAMLILTALGFALINALMEELLWRGVMQDTLMAIFGAAGAAVFIQAVSFGAQHWNGFPRGAAGMVLAGIYGYMLGVLRHYSRGLLAPVIAHIFADLVIFAIMTIFVV